MIPINTWRISAALFAGVMYAAPAVAADLTYKLSPRPPGFAEPRPIKRTHVPYPLEELKNKSSGQVQLDIRVLEDGSVGDVKVTGHTGVAAFEEAARVAAREWRFKPGTLDGKSVAMYHEEYVALNPLDAEEWTRLSRLHFEYHRQIHMNEVLLSKCAAEGFDTRRAQAAVKVDADLRERAARLESRLYEVLEQLGRNDARTAVPASLARMLAKVDTDLAAEFAEGDRAEKIERCKATLIGMLTSGPGVAGELYEF